MNFREKFLKDIFDENGLNYTVQEIYIYFFLGKKKSITLHH